MFLILYIDLYYLFNYDYFYDMQFDSNRQLFYYEPTRSIDLSSYCEQGSCIYRLQGNLEPNKSANFRVYNHQKFDWISVSCGTNNKASIILN